MTDQTKSYIEFEEKFGAYNYHPLPVVLTRGEGVFLWMLTKSAILIFLSGCSAANQGHCHPQILKVLIKQAKQLIIN